MSWKQVDAMSERLRFVRDARQRLETSTALCARYEISRATGYKWLERADAIGFDFLQELSPRPHHGPHATPPEVQARLLAARRHHPTWGPRKLLALVQRQAGCDGAEFAWPARSTVAERLRRRGLTTPRARRATRGHPGRPRTPMSAPNVIWTAACKGRFCLGDGKRCFRLFAETWVPSYGARRLTFATPRWRA